LKNLSDKIAPITIPQQGNKNVNGIGVLLYFRIREISINIPRRKNPKAINNTMLKIARTLRTFNFAAFFNLRNENKVF
jgi:hypothetical protein